MGQQHYTTKEKKYESQEKILIIEPLSTEQCWCYLHEDRNMYAYSRKYIESLVLN